MEYLLSAGIDIGTTTTHLVISPIGIAWSVAGARCPRPRSKKQFYTKVPFTLPRWQTVKLTCPGCRPSSPGAGKGWIQRPTGYERERLHRGIQHQPLRYGTGRSRSLYCRRDPRPAAKRRKVKTNKKRPVVCVDNRPFFNFCKRWVWCFSCLNTREK